MNRIGGYVLVTAVAGLWPGFRAGMAMHARASFDAPAITPSTPQTPSSPSDSTGTNAAATREERSVKPVPGSVPTSPLALKQDMIRDRLDRFRDAVFRLQQELVLQEPENAARLARALARMGETGAAERIAALVARLNRGESLAEIVATQEQVVADMEIVLAVLMRREGDNEERREQIEQLQENLRAIRSLLDRQKELRAQTAAQARGERLRAQLEQAAQRASELLRQQEEMSRATAEANRRSSGMSEDDRFTQARQQADLAARARELAEQLEALLGKASSDIAPMSPGDPGGNPSPEASGAMSNTDQPTGADVGQQAAQDVQHASQRMNDAASSLHAREDADAQQQQKQAEDNLRRAIHRLEEAARKTRDLSAEETARAQHALAEEARRLSENLSPQADQSDAGGDGESAPDGRSLSQPGADPVQKAEREMWDAAEKLEREQREQSIPRQDEALRNLEEARREMEDALTQKRQEEREEILRDLESRFHDMYVKQKRLSEETKALDKVGPENFARAEQLQVAQIAEGESRLAEAADICLHILQEEGTTVVFPRILEQVSIDLKLVAQRLAAMQTGALTQAMQQEIVEALEQLIEAVQRMQRENEQQQQQNGSPSDMNAPLLPTSAELKLLRASQARVHERTAIIDQTRSTDPDAAEHLRKAIESTAVRQKECAEIAAQLRRRIEGD